MPDEFTPEEQDILAHSPADAPVIVGDGDGDDGPQEETADESGGA